jgi:L-threonylcarbamoyladenylate synthase
LIKKPENLEIICIDPLHLRHDQVLKASRMIRNSGIIIFPIQYLYGQGAHALNIEAVDKVFEIKEKAFLKPLQTLIPHRQNLTILVQQAPSAAVYIMNRY